MEKLPTITNPPDIVVATTPTGQGSYTYPEPEARESIPENSDGARVTEVKIDVGECSLPIAPIDANSSVADVEGSAIVENNVKFFPSSPKDLDVLKNVRKVYVGLAEENKSNYKVTNEHGEPLFEATQGVTQGGIWSRYFRQQQKVMFIKDNYGKGVLKLDFGKSRTVSCCQTLRFAAMTAHFKSKWEEPVCVFFKDRGCCIYSCCCSTAVSYESVPQLDPIDPFTVKTKREWRSRAEFMVKHSDGSILAFIDKEKKFYTLTLGENLKPQMKACLIGFVIAMDVMDRADASRLNCYLRPSTYVTILFLFMLFFMIGAFLFHFVTAMILAWPTKGVGLAGCTDAVHNVHDDPFLPHGNASNVAPEMIPLSNFTLAKDI